MGGGSWDSKLYSAKSTERKVRGTPDFKYDSDMKHTTPRSEWKAHDNLDPKNIKDSVNHVRESKDSTEHPESRAIVVIFDVTGSMQSVPQTYQKRLDKLMSFLIMKGGIEHPQILVGAIGDATCDAVPLQISQFESGNLIDEHIRNLVLEGGGGSDITESYELALYAMAKLTSMDCLEKRGQKGYLFISGDEIPYSEVKKDEVKRVFGISEQSNIPLKEIFAEVLEKFYVYFILPTNTSKAHIPTIARTWSQYLGQNILKLDDESAICELIASTVALNEGTELHEIISDLKSVGADEKSLKAASKALANVTVGVSTKGSAKATSVIPSPTDSDSIQRL
jgi:hypothetical protein